MWDDVRRFLRDPGETLERLRAQLASSDDTEELASRQRDLRRRLAARQAEKDRYVRLYAQNHIDEEELETYLLDLKNQIENLRLLIESVEADLSRMREQAEIAETTHAWLLALRDRIAEVEQDTEEAFYKRRDLVKLLVDGIDLGRDETGNARARIIYRFGPPDGQEAFVGGEPNSSGNLAAKRNPSGAMSRHRSTVRRRGVP